MPAFIFVRKNFFCLLASFPLSIDVRVDVGLFSPKRGGFETTGGHRRGGGTLTARLNSHKISFWKRKTASQKHFFIRRKGEKSRGGGRGKFFFREKNTPHTLSSRPTSWILRRFKILFVWWRLTLRGFEPRSSVKKSHIDANIIDWKREWREETKEKEFFSQR